MNSHTLTHTYIDIYGRVLHIFRKFVRSNLIIGSSCQIYGNSPDMLATVGDFHCQTAGEVPAARGDRDLAES